MDCSTVTTNPSGVIESVSDNIERKLGFTVVSNVLSLVPVVHI